MLKLMLESFPFGCYIQQKPNKPIEGDFMKKASFIAVVLLFVMTVPVYAQLLGFNRISNDVTFFRNTDDDINNKGWTLQLVFIDSIHLGTDFQVEYTADYNWGLAWEGKYDYYVEIGILKAVYKGFSINYQRIEGTFQRGGVNQIGLRYHF